MRDTEVTFYTNSTGMIFFITFLPEILGIIAVTIVVMGIAFAGDWIVNHPIIGISLLGVVVVLWTYVKITNIFAQDSSFKMITIIFSLLYIAVTTIFAFMYIIPLWIYCGGVHSVLNTVGCVTLYCIPFFLFKFIFKHIFRWINVGARIAVCDFFSALPSVAVLYFLPIDGIKCYLFDFLGIMAPFI